MTLSFERLHPTIGARVGGLDAAKPVSSTTADELSKALPTYGVLVIPDQHIDDGHQVAFGKSFGELEILPEPDRRERQYPEIFVLTNLKPNGEFHDYDGDVIVFLRGTQRWHTDSSYRAIPSLASILYGVTVPDDGGETEFADMYAAYEALPAARKQVLNGLRLVHSYEYSRAGNPGKLKPMSEEEKRKLPPVEHPLVRGHADGRKSLYLGAHASHVVGMPIDEGRAMLQELTDFATQETFIYRHKWTANDIVIWDNRCTLHRVRGYDITSKARVMRRLAVAGTGPVN